MSSLPDLPHDPVPPPAADTTVAPFVHLLVAEPELGASIPADELRAARRLVVAPTLMLPAGAWDAAVQDHGAFAAVVLDGLLTRECSLAGRRSMHLVGVGDVIPLDPARPAAPVGHLGWRAATDAQVAILDRRFIAAVARWPWLTADVVRRTACWADRAAVLQAISQLPRVEDRVVALLWHLADIWGRVGADGVVLPLRLTHAALGSLVGAQRSTISLALADLREAGVVRVDDGGWLLDPAGRAALDREPLDGRQQAISVVPRDGAQSGAAERARAHRARASAAEIRRVAGERRERAQAIRETLHADEHGPA